MSIPELSSGTSVPSPGRVCGVGSALTCRTLVPVNDADPRAVTSRATPRAPLDQAALQAAAGPPWQVRLYAEAGSTNAIAAADPVPDRIVVADHQQAGRGRLEREWVTPAGAALTFSAVLDPAVDAEWWPLLPLVAGYAVAGAIGDLATLKWPNDVMLGDPAGGAGASRKVSGILVERVGSRPPLAVVGIGINVDQAADELPVPSAVSLALAGRTVDRTTLFGEVTHHLRDSLRLLARSPGTFVDHYRARSATLGRDVRVELPGDVAVAGRVTDFDRYGRILLETPDDVLTLSAGDVIHATVQE